MYENGYRVFVFDRWYRNVLLFHLPRPGDSLKKIPFKRILAAIDRAVAAQNLFNLAIAQIKQNCKQFDAYPLPQPQDFRANGYTY
ncbi:hypothetical protein [Calothrix sp. NIES-2098]|uniref:hypothetical protein n=1 Tax=Calothrix sp. NIES-2098 TaxID=1954171 RepID=UPI000B621393|nr:hypothetical protein NIES2098_23490 [Calothrix sp. NIES-2098]